MNIIRAKWKRADERSRKEATPEYQAQAPQRKKQRTAYRKRQDDLDREALEARAKAKARGWNSWCEPVTVKRRWKRGEEKEKEEYNQKRREIYRQAWKKEMRLEQARKKKKLQEEIDDLADFIVPNGEGENEGETGVEKGEVRSALLLDHCDNEAA